MSWALCACRYLSGFWQWHPLLAGLDYAWRMEPNVHYYCDMTAYDPFIFMQACTCSPCPACSCDGGGCHAFLEKFPSSLAFAIKPFAESRRAVLIF